MLLTRPYIHRLSLMLVHANVPPFVICYFCAAVYCRLQKGDSQIILSMYLSPLTSLGLGDPLVSSGTGEPLTRARDAPKVYSVLATNKFHRNTAANFLR